MTIHVGIFPESGQLSCYNEADKSITDLKIMSVQQWEVEKIDLMYKEIGLKNCDSLGFACIRLSSNYGNKIRKTYIETGLKWGFKNVEIINYETAIFLNAMSQIHYIPLYNDVIWITNGFFLFVWQMNMVDLKYIGCCQAEIETLDDLKNIVIETKLNKGPDMVLNTKNTDETSFRKISKECIFFSYSDENYCSRGSLVKARIAANDAAVSYLDPINHVSGNISLKQGKKEIITFEYGHQLPITFYHKITDKSNSLIVTSGNHEEMFNIPNYKEVYLIFNIDKNEYYSITFDRQPCKHDKCSKNNEFVPSIAARKFLLRSNHRQHQTTTHFFSIPAVAININANVVGIDLGTSRCCAAVNRKNGITTVPLDNTGERLLPSYVAYDEENVKCGKIVVNRLRYHSKSTIFDSKRIIGRDFNDIEIDSNWTFNVTHENNQILLQIETLNGKIMKSAVEVAAELLSVVKRKSQEFQGKYMSKAVITVPTTFDELQKNATIEAAKIAGWNEIVLLPESIAAAFAYFINSTIQDNSTVLLFDLGGGTLDVCIFKIENVKIKIISNTGDSNLGGRNFDEILINHFQNLLRVKYNILMQRDKKCKLMLECQRIKEELSFEMQSSLDVDTFDTTKDEIIIISREVFERMSKTLLEKVKNTIKAALCNSNLNANEINKVLLVGGGSRMPMVKQLLLDMFPNAEHCCEEHPDEVVAIGAAYYAHHIFSD